MSYINVQYTCHVDWTMDILLLHICTFSLFDPLFPSCVSSIIYSFPVWLGVRGGSATSTFVMDGRNLILMGRGGGFFLKEKKAVFSGYEVKKVWIVLVSRKIYFQCSFKMKDMSKLIIKHVRNLDAISSMITLLKV